MKEIIHLFNNSNAGVAGGNQLIRIEQKKKMKE
jgi:hypothetical protein